MSAQPSKHLSAYSVPISFIVEDRSTPVLEWLDRLLGAIARSAYQRQYCDLVAWTFSGPGVAARAIIMVNR